MDNQQERSLAWFAGIMDGEGTISVQCYTIPDGRVRLVPFACITNTDKGILSECSRILDGLGVKYRDIGRKDGINKPVSCLRIDGQKPIRILLEALDGYFLSDQKRKAQKAVLWFLDSRKERGIKRNAKGHLRRVEYSVAEVEMISSIRSHRRAKSSQAIRQAPNVIG